MKHFLPFWLPNRTEELDTVSEKYMRLVLPSMNMLIEGLTIAGIIGAGSIAVLLARYKYQPEIERTWENSKKQMEEQKRLLLLDQTQSK